MRMAGYNVQHDINEEIDKAILGGATDLCRVIPVGNHNACNWLRKVDTQGASSAIDPFDYTKGTMHGQAWLWACLAEHDRYVRLTLHLSVASKLKGKLRAPEGARGCAGRPQGRRSEAEGGGGSEVVLQLEERETMQKAFKMKYESDKDLLEAYRKLVANAPSKLDQKYKDVYAKELLKQLAGFPVCLGIIGGRSGSLDIAAFMGLRTISAGTSATSRTRSTCGCTRPGLSCRSSASRCKAPAPCKGESLTGSSRRRD